MISEFFWGIITQRRVVIFTNVSGQRIGSIFKGQEVQKIEKRIFFVDFLTREDVTDTLSRNVGKGLPLDAV
jgi:hypothetical protein